MKKLLYILFVLNLILTPFYAQPSITWNRLYDGPFNYDDYGKGICQTVNGDFYLVGSTEGFSVWRGLYVIKINAFGDTIWTRAYNNISNILPMGLSVLPTFDGGCVISGGGFVRLNSSGDTVWTKRNTNAGCFEMKRTMDGGYIGCGISGIDWGYLTKIDSVGNLQWERNYPSTFSKRLISVEIGVDGGYIAVGFSKNSMFDTLKMWVLKVDSLGDTVWEKYFNNLTGKKVIKRNETYILSTGRCISRLDKLGNQFYFNCLNLEPYEEIIDMDTLPGNRYLFLTYDRYQVGYSIGRVRITDTTGAIIRTKVLDFAESVELETVLLHANGDIICTGTCWYNDSTRFDVYAVRLDSLLNTPPIGVEPINSITPNQFYLFQNYPNPFNPITKIKFDIPLSRGVSEGRGVLVKLAIYDILGREIAVLVNANLNHGTYEVEFSATGGGFNYPSGVYFYRLTAGEYSESKKMVLIK